MRRVVIIAGAAAAAVGVLIVTRPRGRGAGSSLSSGEDPQYTLFAPGGPQGFWFNGPVGWAFAKVQPFSHAGVYTAITVPANLAEVLRVLRPGGRFVYVDELIADPRKPSRERTGGSPHDWDEADFRRILKDAGFADLSVRYKGVSFLADNRIVACRKPVATRPTAAIGIGGPMVDAETEATPAEIVTTG